MSTVDTKTESPVLWIVAEIIDCAAVLLVAMLLRSSGCTTPLAFKNIGCFCLKLNNTLLAESTLTHVHNACSNKPQVCTAGCSVIPDHNRHVQDVRSCNDKSPNEQQPTATKRSQLMRPVAHATARRARLDPPKMSTSALGMYAAVVRVACDVHACACMAWLCCGTAPELGS